MSQHPHAPAKMHAHKFLGFASVMAMVVSLQLGSSMFLLPNQLAPYGVWALWSWLISGMGALALSHVFATMSQHIDSMGGPHVYVGHAFGKRAAFYVGWSYWVISWVSSLPLLLLATHSLEEIIGPMNPLLRLGVEMLLLYSVVALNLRGLVISGIGEVIFFVLKITPMVLIPLCSVPYWQWQWPTVTESSMSALSSASLLTFWGFVGLEAGTTIANYVKNAAVVVPKALFWGTSIVIGVYIFNTLAIFLTQCALSPNPYGMLLSSLLHHPVGYHIISILIFVMCMGTLNSWMLASGQVAMTAAKEGLFPDLLGKLNSRQSPKMGLFISALAMTMGLFLMKNQAFHEKILYVVNMCTCVFIMIYLAVTAALIKMIMQKKIPPSVWTYGAIIISTFFGLWCLATTQWWHMISVALIPLVGGGLALWRKWPVH